MNTNKMTRRNFMRRVVGSGLGSLAVSGLDGCAWAGTKPKGKRPNILLAIADDWSWPHAGIGGDKVVKTPTFDKVAREGVLFTNAFVSAPSCSPSRSSILTGQWHWQLEEGGSLWGTLPAKFKVYPDILEQTGYYVGYNPKGWGPGRDKPGGRSRNPAGPKYKDFKQFLQARPADKPFCFWFGSFDPHREYTRQSGINSGMKLEDVQVPPCLPDSTEVRSDICDYYWEVQRFDREVGEILTLLKQNNELDNTLIVITGDNGMPFPRCKSNLYDLGTQVPLAVRWGKNIRGGRVVEDFVSLADLAPTFLEAAQIKPTRDMTAQSFLNILQSDKSGCVDAQRDRVFVGKERHAWVREGGVGYPMRAIRTRDYLYIRNFKPDRWPAGSPKPVVDSDPSKEPFGDVGRSPTKTYMMKHRNEAQVKKLFELAFGKRSAEELYDLGKDPGQMNNVAELAEYAAVKQKLAAMLIAELKVTKDPRILGNGDVFDTYPYYGGQRGKKIKR